MGTTEHLATFTGRIHRAGSVLFVSMLLLGAVACGAGALVSTGEEPDPAAPPPPDAGMALVVTEAGLAGVPVGTSTPRWVVPGAVAAPDGSAVFVSRTVADPAGEGFEVVRIDPLTGAEQPVGRHTPGPAGIHVSAVAPGGGSVALVAPGDGPTIDGSTDGRTLVLDFDPARGGPRSKPTFDGRVEPEAYSLDGTLMFAARVYEHGYHVHVLDLVTGRQQPTASVGPVPSKPEVMYGSVVQAALSPDGTQLATLYRDSSRPEHTAFVHLLRLDSGRTVCIDLHAPFGSATPGVDALAWQPDGTVGVGHRGTGGEGSMVATFEPAAIWSGPYEEHHHADAVPTSTPPTIPTGIDATPGFVRFVALVP